MTQTYLTSESGAVTVDWVVLTAALVGLGLATMAVVSSGVENVSGDTQRTLETMPIRTTFLSWDAASGVQSYLATGDFGDSYAALANSYGIDWSAYDDDAVLNNIANYNANEPGQTSLLQTAADYREGSATWEDVAAIYGSSATTEADFLADMSGPPSAKVSTEAYLAFREQDATVDLVRRQGAMAEADARNLTY